MTNLSLLNVMKHRFSLVVWSLGNASLTRNVQLHIIFDISLLMDGKVGHTKIRLARMVTHGGNLI